MQKRSILIFLVGLMFLQGCSIYHGDSTQPALGPQVEEVHTLPTQGQGPTLSSLRKPFHLWNWKMRQQDR